MRLTGTFRPDTSAWKPAVQPELDYRASKRLVERTAADDSELAVCRAIELRRNGQPAPMPERLRRALPPQTREGHEKVARRGLHQMSRTAMGIVDVSAARDKAAVMATLSGEQARRATESSLHLAVDWMYQNRLTVFSSPAQLRQFVERLAQIITDGVLKPEHLIRSHDSDKYPYTLTKDLEAAMAQFYEELLARMAASESPRTLAPWIEYRVNLSDHFFADGCGKASQLLAGFACMRADHPLPLHRSAKEYYALSGTTRRGVDPSADAKTLQCFTAYYQKLFLPHDVFESVEPHQVNDALHLLKERDYRPRLDSDSGNTYEVRRSLLAKGPESLEDVIQSGHAYTYLDRDGNDVTHRSNLRHGKALMKAYLSDPSNWIPERRSLHDQVYSDRRTETLELHERIAEQQPPGAKPLLLLMRGNSGVGKTYFLNKLANATLPELGLPSTPGASAGVINPDTFKEQLRGLLPEQIKWSAQIHAESSVLTDRLIAEMRESGRHLVVDKRLATPSDVAEVTGPGGASGHRVVMVDIDAPLDVSLKACKNRDDQGASARPPEWAIIEGFEATRWARQDVAESPLLDAYHSFARVLDDQGRSRTVAVATRNPGEPTVTPEPSRTDLWRQITAKDSGAHQQQQSK